MYTWTDTKIQFIIHNIPHCLLHELALDASTEKWDQEQLSIIRQR